MSTSRDKYYPIGNPRRYRGMPDRVYADPESNAAIKHHLVLLQQQNEFLLEKVNTLETLVASLLTEYVKRGAGHGITDQGA